MEGVEPSTVALLAQRSNQLSYTTSTENYSQNPYKNLLKCFIKMDVKIGEDICV